MLTRENEQTWLDESTPPPGEFANCKVCNQPMNLLLELHGDLPDDFPTDERRLYIFGCARKPCARKPGSIRALRATRKVEIEPQQENKEKVRQEKEEEKKPEEKSAPKQDLGASLFGASTLTGNISANANPFSSQANSDNSSSNNNNPFATPVSSNTNTNTSSKPKDLSETFADKVRISTPDQLPSQPPSNFTPKDPPERATNTTPWPPQSAFPPAYPHYYLDAEHEALSRPSSPTIPENVTIDNSTNDGTADLKDTFESELDKAFLRFSTRLEHNPEQILRYEFRGEPLLYSYADEIGKRLHKHHHQPSGHVQVQTTGGNGGGSDANIPRCEYCGTQRVFELQLVPHAISMLEDGREKLGLDPKDDAGMEWGTILLGVCGKDCAPEKIGVTGWREEWVGVQWEELAK